MKNTKRTLGMTGLTAVLAVSMMGGAFAADTKDAATPQVHSEATSMVGADTDLKGNPLQNKDGAAVDSKEMTFSIVMVDGDAANGSFLVIRLDEETGRKVCSRDGGKTWEPYDEAAAALGTHDAIIEISTSKAAENK